MLNLLPIEEKNKIRREYIFRRLSAVFLLLFFVLVISSILLFPVYILSKIRLDEIKKENVELSKKINTVDDEEKLASLVKEIGDKTAGIKPALGTEINKAFSSVISDRPANIKITGLDYKKNAPNKAEITITGVSADRESLKSYGKRLQDDIWFSEVNLPISNFAKAKNIDFSIKIVVK